MTPPDRHFPLFGALPSGQVAIEASAGTGKTHTLATLATRYVAEWGVTPSELLIVTFTRAATAELRSRIRLQMVAGAAALACGTATDELSDHMLRARRPEYRQRLEDAVSDFDTATIATMHSFAGQVRGMLGISSAVDPDARITSDVAGPVRQACADVLAGAATGPQQPGALPSLSKLESNTLRYVADPDMVLEPTPNRADAPDDDRQLRRLVLAATELLAARRQASGTMSFDDVVGQLRSAIADPSSAAVAEALRRRFRVVLIDEFQDTDRVQWEIFSSLFAGASADRALVLVGDPKQAIYRFRGADIAVYLDAVAEARGHDRYTLGTNWRSDGAAVEAVRHVFSGATFGSADIGYVDVAASPARENLRMTGPDGGSLSGLAVRVAVGPWLPRARKLPSTPGTGRIIYRDLVAYVRRLLDDAALPTADGATRPVRPVDIAVLVTSGGQARAVQGALRRQGVPAVVAGAGSVLTSWAADQLRLLLAAMERPSDLGRVRAYTLSWFASWSPERLAGASDEQLAGLQEQLADWSDRLARQPVAEVLAAVRAETDVVARLLGGFDGDRNVTDLDHLAELLHEAAPQGMSGVSGLLSFLDRPPAHEGDPDVDGDLEARRIESDDQAVQIMTIWKAKGLAFPVVCLPSAWRPGRSPDTLVYSDPVAGRTMDVAGGKGWSGPPSRAERKEYPRAEEAAEQLRLLYVACTRAEHHTAVWWADSIGSKGRALSRLLFARDTDGAIDPAKFETGACDVPAEEDVVAALGPLVERSGGTVTVTAIDEPGAPDGPWVGRSGGTRSPDLGVHPFTVALDRSVRRWSFSSITAAVDDGPVDPYDPSGADGGADDEDATADAPPGDGPAPGTTAGEPSPPGDVGARPLDGLPAGTEFGTFVHAVLERVDFAAPDLERAVTGAVDAVLDGPVGPRRLVTSEGTDGHPLLVSGLRAAIGTPLGPLFHGRALADIGPGDRLNELGFDLRIGGAGHHPSVRELGILVGDHLPAGHGLRPWAEALADGAIDVRLAGYLTGSVDLVARVRGDDGATAFVVADYKTNRLTPWGHAPDPDDYDDPQLVRAMSEHHYPLQALLYGVALHRYLRARRRPGGAPTEVTGATYLFVRGMTGAAAPTGEGGPHGVYSWPFAPGLLDAASALLDGRSGDGGS